MRPAIRSRHGNLRSLGFGASLRRLSTMRLPVVCQNLRSLGFGASLRTARSRHDRLQQIDISEVSASELH